jgi:hypothetical protein
MPTHKTAHLQTTQASSQPKFAKELFSCQRTQAHPPPTQRDGIWNLKIIFDNNGTLNNNFTTYKLNII